MPRNRHDRQSAIGHSDYRTFHHQEIRTDDQDLHNCLGTPPKSEYKYEASQLAIVCIQGRPFPRNHERTVPIHIYIHCLTEILKGKDNQKELR
jgi:hypothetical protein